MLFILVVCSLLVTRSSSSKGLASFTVTMAGGQGGTDDDVQVMLSGGKNGQTCATGVIYYKWFRKSWVPEKTEKYNANDQDFGTCKDFEANQRNVSFTIIKDGTDGLKLTKMSLVIGGNTYVWQGEAEWDDSHSPETAVCKSRYCLPGKTSKVTASTTTTTSRSTTMASDGDGFCPKGYDAISQDLNGEGKEWSQPHPLATRTIEDCAAICNARSGCTSFEFAEGASQHGACGTFTGGYLNIQGGKKRLKAKSKWRSCMRKHNKEDSKPKISTGWIICLVVLGVFFFFLICCVLHAVYTCRRYRAVEREDDINIKIKTKKQEGCFWWTILHTGMYFSGRMQKKINDHRELKGAFVERNPNYGYAQPHDDIMFVDYNNDYYGDAK